MSASLFRELSYKIETSRLSLSIPRVGDFSTLKNLWRDEKVRQFLGGALGEDQIHQKIVELHNHWALYQFGLWVVQEKTSLAIMGLCGLHRSEDGIELSYMFFPEFWGKGVASEAILASLDDGFNRLNIKEVIAITQKANVRSYELLKRIGMTHIKNVERFNAIQCFFKLTSGRFNHNKMKIAPIT